MRRSNHRAPEHLTGNNPVEVAFLKTMGRLNTSGGIEIAELALQSAMNDLREDDMKEQIWPTKEVLTERLVEYPDRDGTMKAESVFRCERVPMTPEEAQEHYHRVFQELIKINSPAKVKKPKAAAPTAKVTPKKKKAGV